MYERLGYQWASFLAGMIALALSATPWILFHFGPQIRAKVRFCSASLLLTVRLADPLRHRRRQRLQSKFAKELARIQEEQKA